MVVHCLSRNRRDNYSVGGLKSHDSNYPVNDTPFQGSKAKSEL